MREGGGGWRAQPVRGQHPGSKPGPDQAHVTGMNADATGTLAMNLRQLREARQWSQEELAARSGVALATIAKLEAGAIRPQPTVLRRLAQALGLTPEDLARQLSEARRARAAGRGTGLASWR
jgi:ribosome-binding protein aMBF1 (putative translation factor)